MVKLTFPTAQYFQALRELEDMQQAASVAGPSEAAAFGYWVNKGLENGGITVEGDVPEQEEKVVAGLALIGSILQASHQMDSPGGLRQSGEQICVHCCWSAQQNQALFF